MSQLNKKYFIVLGIISVLAIGITVFFIVKDKPKESTGLEPNNPSEKPDEPNNEFAGGQLMNIYKKYYENPLDVKIVNPTVEHVESITISGLKNKEIENKINDQFKSVLENKEYGYCTVAANFSNVLSISCNYSKFDYYNFDLNTGETITFRDMLKDGKYDYQKFLNTIYDTILDYHGELLEDINKEIDEYGDVYAMQMMNKIENNNLSFGFSAYHLIMSTGGNRLDKISVSYNDLKDYIAIYDRYLSEENIFEKEPTSYFLPLTNNYSSSTMHTYNDYIDELTRFDYTATDNEKYMDDTIFNKVKKEILDKNYHKKDQFQYIKASSNIIEYVDGLAIVNTNIEIYSMTKKEYEQFYFDIDYKKNYKSEKIQIINMYLEKNGNIYYGSKNVDNIDTNKVYDYLKKDKFLSYVSDSELKKLIANASYSVDEKKKMIYVYSMPNDCAFQCYILNNIIPFSDALKDPDNVE